MRCIYIMILLFFFETMKAQGKYEYSMNRLQYIAEQLKIQNDLDTIAEGIHLGIFSYRGSPLTICLRNNVIEHIGYAIFSKEQRVAFPSPIYNFLERFFLEEQLPLKERDLPDREQVTVVGGNINKILNHVNDSTVTLSITQGNGQVYSVLWRKGSKVLCKVIFPSNFELISGKNRIENEDRLLKSIRKTKVISKKEPIVYLDDLENPNDSISHCVIVNRGYNRISAMKNNRYYTVIYDSIAKRDSLSLTYSSDYPVESFNNLLTSLEISNDFLVEVEILKYNFQNETFSIPLSQFLSFFYTENCIPYLGIMNYDTNSNQIEALLEMRNNELAYEHMMRIEMDLKNLPRRSGTLSITMWPYIPTHILNHSN